MGPDRPQVPTCDRGDPGTGDNLLPRSSRSKLRGEVQELPAAAVRAP